MPEMSGLTDILCSLFQSQRAHFLFFLHRVPEIRTLWQSGQRIYQSTVAVTKNPRIFGIQILILYRRLQLRGLPSSQCRLRYESLKSLSC